MSEPLYGADRNSARRITVNDLAAAKVAGDRWPMITAYDALTAGVFDDAGIPVMLVGDSAAMVVYGYDSTIPITVDDLIPLTRAVVRGSRRAMVVADLPFGSYQQGPAQALATATRFMKRIMTIRQQNKVPPGDPSPPRDAVGVAPGFCTGAFPLFLIVSIYASIVSAIPFP